MPIGVYKPRKLSHNIKLEPSLRNKLTSEKILWIRDNMNHQIDKHKIYGIDFSGAKNAHNKIWICEATIKNTKLQIDDCWRLADKIGKVKRDLCFPALKELIESETNAAFGLDFPFGLPRSLLNGDDWETFIHKFPQKHKNPEQFRQTCYHEAGRMELKRCTEIKNKTPFCAYNLRLFRQTFYGIHDVLHPLVRYNSACIMPMQEPEDEKPWVFEICPASTLKRDGLYYQYKGKTVTERHFRERILDGLIENGLLQSISTNVRETVLKDTEGDALDSIVAAVATCRALLNNIDLAASLYDDYKDEGYIYV